MYRFFFNRARTHAHARTHARARARTHARTHALKQKTKQKITQTEVFLLVSSTTVVKCGWLRIHFWNPLWLHWGCWGERKAMAIQPPPPPRWCRQCIHYTDHFWINLTGLVPSEKFCHMPDTDDKIICYESLATCTGTWPWLIFLKLIYISTPDILYL